MSRSNEANSTIEEWETARERMKRKRRKNNITILCRFKMKIYVSKAALDCEFQFCVCLDRITPSPTVC